MLYAKEKQGHVLDLGYRVTGSLAKVPLLKLYKTARSCEFAIQGGGLDLPQIQTLTVLRRIDKTARSGSPH